MMILLALRTWRGLDSSSIHQACKMNENTSFDDLSLCVLGEQKTIKLNSTNLRFKMAVITEKALLVCNQ